MRDAGVNGLGYEDIADEPDGVEEGDEEDDVSDKAVAEGGNLTHVVPSCSERGGAIPDRGPIAD